MADWTATTQSANQYDTNASAEARAATRGGSRGSTGGSFDPGSYDVVGINATKAKASGDSIVSSSKRVMDKIEGITMEEATLDSAVKGEEMQQALKDYLAKVKLYCEGVVSDVNAFADKLYEVSRVWEESQKNYATGTISGDAASSFSGDSTTVYQTVEAQGGGN